MATGANADPLDICPPPANPGVTCTGDVQSDGPGVNSTTNVAFGELVWVGRDADGTLVIDGVTETLGFGNTDDANPNLTVARNRNTGVMTVTNGGTFQMTGDDTGAFVQVGDGNGGIGTLNILDGSSFTMTDTNVTVDGIINRDVYIDVGNFGGNGTLNLDDGSLRIESNALSGLSAGSAGNSVGLLSLANGSDLTITTSGDRTNKGGADLKAGRGDGGGNFGTIDVIDSTVLIEAPAGDARLELGEDQGTGIATISGATASVTLDADDARVQVGDGPGGFGTLTVENDGSLLIDGSDDSVLQVGSRNDAVGRLDILSGGTVTVGTAGSNRGIMDIGDPSPTPGEVSTGIVRVDGTGSRLDVLTDILVGQVGSAGATSGLLTVSNGGTVATPFIGIDTGGVVNGNGTLAAGTVEVRNGGVIAPGLSPGMLTIDGDLAMDGGRIEIEVEGTGAGQFDVLNVLGDASSTGALFDIVVSFNGFVPSPTDVIPVLQVAGTVAPSFTQSANLSLIGLSGSASLVPTASGFGIATTDPTPIPLPASALLLLGGLAGLVTLKRRAAG